jgi:hypothetical protein
MDMEKKYKVSSSGTTRTMLATSLEEAAAMFVMSFLGVIIEIEDEKGDVYFMLSSVAAHNASVLMETLERAEKKKENAMDRPVGIENEHLQYLDELRDSGETNMYGAVPYLMSEFPELDKPQARVVLSYWMKTFGDSNR